MEHSFDVDLAKKYGMLEAVLINNFQFWIEKNRANGVNFHDGCYWTYNSTKAFTELFPYATQKQIRRALQHLIDEEIIKTGNYNTASYDRTLWYAFTEKGKCICPVGQMEMPVGANGFDREGKPIPDNKPDNKPDNNRYSEIVSMYNEICKSFPKLVKITDSRKKAIHARLETYTVDDFREMFELAESSDFLKGKNNRNWSATFDWMIKDTNMAKVLEGNYNNREKKKPEQREESKDFNPEDILKQMYN